MKHWISAVFIFSTCTAIQAQELSLFEELRSSKSQQISTASSPEPVNRAPLSSDPEFTLRSTARFGDNYQIVLQDRSGKAVFVNWQQNSESRVPERPGFFITNIDAGKLTLKLPAASPCIVKEVSGVECLDQSTALLSLAPLNPLAQNGTPFTGSIDAPFGRVIVDEDAEIEDPFAAAIAAQEAAAQNTDPASRAERARLRAERMSQFEPVRIPENEIPAGMRAVRTPFGDRLVPIRE